MQRSCTTNSTKSSGSAWSCWTLAFIVAMLAIEMLILQPIETRARAWRTA